MMQFGRIWSNTALSSLIWQGRMTHFTVSPCIITLRHRHSGNSIPRITKDVTFEALGEKHTADTWSNVTPSILNKVGRSLHNQKYHPLCLIKQRIINFFYANFTNRSGNPTYAVFDNLSPIVTTHQNFDSLLIAADHPSRSKSDTYYIKDGVLLRAQTSAHQEELIKMGFDAFLAVGDVYRRDEIDSTHYPVFHQMEGVRLFSETEVCSLYFVIIFPENGAEIL